MLPINSQIAPKIRHPQIPNFLVPNKVPTELAISFAPIANPKIKESGYVKNKIASKKYLKKN